jgi:hypothetical protein
VRFRTDRGGWSTRFFAGRRRTTIGGMSATLSPTPAPPASSSGGAGRVVAVVGGCILVLIGVALLATGGVLAWADGERDADGFVTSPGEQFATSSYALTTDELDLSGLHDRPGGAELQDVAGRVRIRATGLGGRPVFVGIAREEDADRFLANIPHSHVTSVDPPRYRTVGGEGRPGRPGDADFWAASASGTGRQQVTWKPEDGRWTVVVMNADGTAGVRASVRVGAELDWLLAAALALIAAGIAFTAVGGTVIAVAARPVATAPVAEIREGRYPVALDLQLDEPLSRGLWLVKWLLAIPHFVVLAFLWLTFYVLTAFALIAVAITGRYPRSLFDFNVGVMRWSWRVTAYAYALGTDRYPPFTLARADHPAAIEVPYPERLSRWKALLKFWLLAIPHYVILAPLLGTWAAVDRAGFRPPGVLQALFVIVGAVLLFTGRYPADVFRLVVGIHRWAFRVLAYAAGMRDEYPPFRFED